MCKPQINCGLYEHGHFPLSVFPVVGGRFDVRRVCAEFGCARCARALWDYMCARCAPSFLESLGNAQVRQVCADIPGTPRTQNNKFVVQINDR